MSQKQLNEGYHFSISLGKALFSDLLGAALPFRVGGGPFNLVENLRDLARTLQVKEKVAGLLEGENAIAKNREIMGATNPANAAEGTLRKLYADSVGENAVHGSDAPETAAVEIAYFFRGTELH